MKIALIGYGKMGHEIEKIALQRGHEVVCTIDVESLERFSSEAFRTADVAIEFTTPATAVDNYLRCFAAGVPVVSGTTGWLDRRDEVEAACRQAGGTFFYSSNYSLGMNVFFAVNRYLAEKMNAFPQYEVSMKEVHHIHKLDAPSGTAVSLAEDILAHLDRKTSWENRATEEKTVLGIVSERTGEVPGFHEVVYDSPVDTLRISHDAKNRAGLALGAVVAAEFAAPRKGVLGMGDMLGF